MRKLFTYLILILFVVLNSCSKKDEVIFRASAKGVFISNEGGYGYGNAEISFCNIENQQVVNNIFQLVNNYKPGDVAQSIFLKDSLAFIVMNNSQKIEVVDLPYFKHVRTITIPGSSPRYFQPVNDSMAYVTELYAGKVYVINYLTGELVRSIGSVLKWTEHMVNFGSYVIVEERNLDQYPSDKCSVAKISTDNHAFIQRYTFNGTNIGGIAKDKDGRLWIAIEEDTVHAVHSSLTCLNSDLSINKAIDFPFGHNLSNLSVNGAGDALYFCDSEVKRVSINDTSPPVAPLIPRNNRNFYALGVDPVSEDIYVSDALDYVQSSRVYHYDKNGQLINTFTAGVISGNFAFRYE